MPERTALVLKVGFRVRSADGDEPQRSLRRLLHGLAHRFLVSRCDSFSEQLHALSVAHFRFRVNSCLVLQSTVAPLQLVSLAQDEKPRSDYEYPQPARHTSSIAEDQSASASWRVPIPCGNLVDACGSARSAKRQQTVMSEGRRSHDERSVSCARRVLLARDGTYGFAQAGPFDCGQVFLFGVS